MRMGWMLAVFALVLSCGTSVPITGAKRISRSALLERIQAGSTEDEHESRPEEHARLRRIAETALRVGNREDAEDAASMLMQSATNWSVIASVSGDQAEREAAEASLASARAFTLRLSHAIDAPSLTLDALGPSPKSSDAKAYLDAAKREGAVSSTELATALKLIGDKPVERIVFRALVRANDDESIAIEDLRAAGLAGFGFLETRWNKKVGSQDERRALREIATAILAVDPLYLPARIAKLYWSEVAEGTLQLDKDLECAMTGHHAGGTQMVRLGRATKAHPKAESLALGRVLQLSRSGLPGDALVVLEDARKNVVKSDEGKAIAAYLQAILALRVGDVAGYKQWARSAHAERSVSATNRELTYSSSEEASVWTELVREARVRSFERGYESGSTWWHHRFLASDPMVSRSVHKRVLQRMRGRDPEGAAVAQHCLATSAMAAECERLFDDVDELGENDGLSNPASEVLRRVAKVQGLPASLLWGLTGQKRDVLASLREPVAALQDRAWASSAAYVALRVQTLLADESFSEARAFFDANGALLGASSRLLYHLAIDDLAAGRTSVDTLFPALYQTYHRLRPLRVEPSAHAEWIAKNLPGEGKALSLARGRAYWNAGHADRALLEWDGLSWNDAGGESHYLAAIVALAAQEAQKSDALASAKAYLENAPNRSSLHTWLDMRTMQADAPARRWAKVRAALWAEDPVLYEYLSALGRERPGPEGLGTIREILSGPGANLDWDEHWLPLASKQSWLKGGSDAVALLAVLLAKDRGAAAAKLPAELLTVREVAWWVSRYFAERIAKEESPKAARALAKEALAALTKAESQPRATIAWLHVLAGQPEKALAVATSSSKGRPALKTGHLVVFAAKEQRANPKLFDESLTHRLWKYSVRHEGRGLDLAQTLSDRGMVADGAHSLACRILVDADLQDEALVPCMRAFTKGGASPSLAAGVTYLLVNREQEAQALGYHPEDVFKELQKRMKGAGGAVWQRNYSVWLRRRGRYEEAAKAADEASAGDENFRERPDEDELKQARFRGAGLRRQMVNGYSGTAPTKALLLSYLALLEGRPEIARYYMLVREADGWSSIDEEFADLDVLITGVLQLYDEDRARGAIDANGVGLWIRGTMGEGEEGDVRRFASQYPNSQLYLLTRSEDQSLEVSERLRIVKKIYNGSKNNPYLLSYLTRLYMANKEYDAARSHLAHALATFPNRIAFKGIVVPEIGGSAASVEMSKEKEFRRALERVSEAELASLKPERYRELDEATSVFLPETAKLTTNDGIAVTTALGARLTVRSFARAAMCEGVDCLTGIAEGLIKRGFTELWRAPTTLPSGPGADILLQKQDTYLLMTVVPVGGRLFALYFASTGEVAAKSFAEIRLMRDTFRPLDRWIPAPASEALRVRTAYLTDEEVTRAAMRQVSTAAKASCPIGQLLAAQKNDDVRAQVLMEAVLDASTEKQRVGLFSCAKPTSPVAARLAVLALGSESTELQGFGHTAAQSFPKETARDATAALLDAEATAVSATNRQATKEAAPYGILQVLSALPVETRREVASEMLKTDSPRTRFLTIMAAGLVGDAVEEDLLRLQIRNSPANAASVAVNSAFLETPETAVVNATRARFDSLSAPLGAAERSFVTAAATGLATLLDASDAPRLKRAVELLDKAKEGDASTESEVQSLKNYLEGVQRRHARALELRAAGTSANTLQDAEDAGAYALVEIAKRRASGAAPAGGIDKALLADTPLAELLGGTSWNYARIQQPGLFVATLRGLYRRLRGASKLDTVVLRRVGPNIAGMLGLELFSDEGGLDLSRPVECATPGGVDQGFICSAYVKDARSVREHLYRRSLGRDSGLALAMKLAEGGAMAPIFAAGAPLFLHGVIRHSQATSSANVKVIAEERLRTDEKVYGHSVERLMVAHANEDGNTVFDNEYYLFAGERLYVFSQESLAGRLLREHDSTWTPFSDGADFRKVAADWKDGASLQAFLLGGTGATFKDATGLEVYAEPDGLRVRLPAGERRSFSDASATAARIPGKPISQVSFGMGSEASSGRKGSKKTSMVRADVLGVYERKTLGVAPPDWIIKHARQASFAWYAPRNGRLWDDWVAAIADSKALAKALRSEGVRLGRDGAIREVDERFYAKSKGIILIASERARLEEALALDTSKAREPEFLSGRLDGALCASAMRAISKSVNSDMKSMLTVFAVYASALEVAEFRTVAGDGQSPRFEGWIRPRLASEGVDLETVDQWLASPKIRNSATLPAPIARKDLKHPLRIRTKVTEDAAGFANSFAGSSRLEAKVSGPDEVVLTIQPGARLSGAVKPSPLTKSAKTTLLGTQGFVNPAHPRIQDLAKRIVPKGSSPQASAKAVLAWMKDNIRYEITPRGIDAASVLDRKRGDCTEYSVLAVSLLRASGVPAELRQGMALDGAKMVAHNWIAYHDGTGWREADPTSGSATVGSGHIEASLLEFLSLISVGGLSIVSAEVVK